MTAGCRGERSSAMVELLNFQVWQFHTGIERLRAAFRGAIAAIEAEQGSAQEACDRYVASGQDDREYDKDGILIQSTEASLQFDSMEAVLATGAVRQAFVTSTFHFWERSARAWTRCEGNFPALRKCVEAQGIPVDERLRLLNTLNNLLKHDSETHGEQVFKIRPDLFMWRRRPTGRNWQSSIALTNKDVEEFLDAIARSGPAQA